MKKNYKINILNANQLYGDNSYKKNSIVTINKYNLLYNTIRHEYKYYLCGVSRHHLAKFTN